MDKKEKSKELFKNSMLLLLIVLSILSVRLVMWVFHNWGNLKMDEFIYTMTASKQGTNTTMIEGAIKYCVPWGIVAGVLAAILIIYLHKRENYYRIRRWTAVISVIAIICSISHFFINIGIIDYVKNQFIVTSFIDENYVAPDSVDIVFPEQKKNLVYIYVESMESTFSSTEFGGGKKKNVIPELTELGLENGTFSGNKNELNGGYALYGATYTMGGLFAQTSGLPLVISNETLTLSDGFIPGITVLGDILDKNGYKNVFCIGTDAAFGERGTYFSTHGNYEIMDYGYSIEKGEIPDDYSREWWGYDDSILYENAKKHLTELSQQDHPFNFTMLTVDTHAEDGYICDLCDDEFDIKYSNAFACASRQVVEFVEWIKDQPFYDNTVIVISGDHCTMDSDYCDDVDGDYERRVFTTWINSSVSERNDEHREYCTMDYFPTTLAAMGVSIEGDKLGLGTNLFSNEKTLVEIYGKEELDEKLAQKTQFFDGYISDVKTHTVNAEYDDSIGSVVITMDVDNYLDWEYKDVVAELSCPNSDISTKISMELKNGKYYAEVPLDDFDFEPADYQIDVYFVLNSNLYKWYAKTTILIQEINYKSPFNINLDEKNKMAEISYAPPENAYYKTYYVPVWSEKDGQDDLKWYKLEKNNDGIWTTSIDLSQHAESGESLVIQLYGGDEAAEDIIKTRRIKLPDEK
ncbi:sulfatase-like hydrolase/transferase [Butyrivibrio sp. AE3004]|uniref:sulfatase-like hydrolase/transferase n=1 Tax=Butyrivibrio sp. AE3004 TaxID=1506994 RepID=UPI00068C0AF3|nr:sulfatase-like hydrolase/transferase [Butyrivibrio sp. AE3004]